MLDSRPAKRPSCFDILGSFGSFQMSKEQLKNYPEFDAMRDLMKANVEANGDSILLDYLSDLDEQGPILPKIFGNLKDTFIRAVQGTSAQNEQGYDQQGQQPMKTLFNTNHHFVRAVSNLWEELREVPENIRKEKERFQNS